MSNIDQSAVITAQDRAAAFADERAGGIKAACGLRIFDVVDQIAQINIAAAAAAGSLSEQEMTTYRAGLNWINEMRHACGALIADAAADWQDDAVWPALPDGVAELAARF